MKLADTLKKLSETAGIWNKMESFSIYLTLQNAVDMQLKSAGVMLNTVKWQ
jgi:hypothetical protein